MKFLLTVGCLIGFVLVIGIAIFGIVSDAYNSLVISSQSVESQWSQVENVYQRRFDLIPNLVESTKGIFEQEREVFGAIANARTHYANAPANSQDKLNSTTQLDSALARLLVVIENYPQLRSSEIVNGLMFELSGTENRISVERYRYNESVMIYNTKTKTFIGRFFAAFFGFTEKPYFKSVEGSQLAPKVNLSLK